MSVNDRKIFCPIAALLIICSVCGCEKKPLIRRGTKELAPMLDLGPTIGSAAEVTFTESIPVIGYGLVGGLNGTGSTECPPQIRTYLKRYIPTQMHGQEINVDELINSRDTAVVRMEGMMPTTGLKNKTFDVRVTALPGTQTTSLRSGWLYNAEMTATTDYAVSSRTLATAKGAVFIDTINDANTNEKSGYILAGGTVLDEYKISVTLGDDDYVKISQIRNRINELYNEAKATAISPRRIELSVPGRYKAQKQKFASILKATYLDQTPELTEERIKTFVRELAVSNDKEASEIALEAIGNQSVSKLATLLNSSNEEVRLRAARCMLNMSDNRGLEILIKTAMDSSSAHRVEALEAIAKGAKRNDAVIILKQFLRDADFNIELAAYEQLRGLEDVTITRELIGRVFYLEQVSHAGYKAIYVFRSGPPRIVLFGAPIYCRDGFLVRSGDGNIAIVSRRGEKYVSVVRKHPARPVVIGPLRSSFKVDDIIHVLCDEPLKEGEEGHGGLGISYAEAIALLKQMCDKGVIQAEFRAGPLPKFD